MKSLLCILIFSALALVPASAQTAVSVHCPKHGFVDGYSECPICKAEKTAQNAQSSSASVGNNAIQQSLNQGAYNVGYAFGQWLTSGPALSPAQRQAMQLNEQGNQYHDKGDFQTALKIYEEAMKLDPNEKLYQRNYYNCLGQIAYANQDARTALQNYQKALSLMNGQDDKLPPRIRKAQELLATQTRDKIASHLAGTLKLGDSSDSASPRFDGDNGAYVNKGVDVPNNPLGLKLGDSADDNLRPKGTAFFGDSGLKNPGSLPPGDPANDTRVVDLRDHPPKANEPAAVQGDAGTLQSQSGAGIQQVTSDKLPSVNPTKVASLNTSSSDVKNPLGLKLGNAASDSQDSGAKIGTGGLSFDSTSPKSVSLLPSQNLAPDNSVSKPAEPRPLGPAPDLPVAWGTPEEVHDMLSADLHPASMDVSKYIDMAKKYISDKVWSKSEQGVGDALEAQFGALGKIFHNEAKLPGEILPTILDLAKPDLTQEQLDKADMLTARSINTLFNTGSLENQLADKLIEKRDIKLGVTSFALEKASHAATEEASTAIGKSVTSGVATLYADAKYPGGETANSPGGHVQNLLYRGTITDLTKQLRADTKAATDTLTPLIDKWCSPPQASSSGTKE